MTFKTEFPDFDPATMPAIPVGFDDVSWANDVCPSFFAPADDLTLWIDYADPKRREFESAARFGLYHQRHDDGAIHPSADRLDLYEGDNWADLLSALQCFRQPAGMRRVRFYFDEADKASLVGYADGSMWNEWPRVWAHPAVVDRLLEGLDDEERDHLVAQRDEHMTADWLVPLEGWTPTLLATSEDMSAELTTWCAAQGLEAASADEMLMALPNLTQVQRLWLTAFVRRWEDAERAPGFWSV